MARRLLLLLALSAVFAAPALGGDSLGEQKAQVDSKLAHLHSKIAAQQAKEGQLSTQIAGLTSQIHVLELKVGNVSSRLSVLEDDLALHQKRLDKLNALFHLQTLRFHALQRSYALAVQRLEIRLVGMYKSNQPTAVDIVLAARSFDDALSQLDYLKAVANGDKRIALAVKATRQQVRKARAATGKIRTGVAQETQVVKARTMQQAILRGELLAAHDKLANARSSKNADLVATKQSVQDEIDESNALAASSAQLAAKIKEAEGASSGSDSGPPAAGGFIWPVTGPITSPFGQRWGTLHPGVDIGVPSGTPVHAANSGTVIWCGWMSGYGNLVMIDHHNGLVTLYGHNTSVAVHCNEQVSQGQVVSYSGCTGYCTGPHVHFEVRLHGTPVDPLGYLP
ncbi:MAG: peptidoglycan DD-metalloendopeptidase family protein [Actinomycetota bacterium]